jgi:cholesterol transport system auxiliary component
MMISLRTSFCFAFATCQLLLLCGCSLSKAYPAKSYYFLSATRNAADRPPQAKVLRVQRLEISSAFAGKGLVSRLSEVEYESDYYAEFFTRSNDMITEQLVSWLRESGQFQEVIGEASTLPAEWVIEGVIDGLYADLRDVAQPKAVLSFQIRVIDDRGRRPEVMATRKYSRSEVVPSSRSPDLVQGWNRALEALFSEVEEDLAAIQ